MRLISVCGFMLVFSCQVFREGCIGCGDGAFAGVPTVAEGFQPDQVLPVLLRRVFRRVAHQSLFRNALQLNPERHGCPCARRGLRIAASCDIGDGAGGYLR